MFFVNDLLDFGQIRNRKFKKEIRKFNIFEAVSEVVQIMSDQAEAKGILVRTDFSNFGQF